MLSDKYEAYKDALNAATNEVKSLSVILSTNSHKIYTQTVRISMRM